MSRTHDRTKTISTFDKRLAGAGWMGYLQLSRELSKVIANGHFNGSQALRNIIMKLRIRPSQLHGLVHVRGRYVFIRLVKATSSAKIKYSKTQVDVIISIDGKITRILERKKPNPYLQQRRRKARLRRLRARKRRLWRRNRYRLSLDQIILSDQESLNDDLALDSSSGFSQSASGMFLAKAEEKQSENEGEGFTANPLNKSGIHTNRPTVIINSTYVPIEPLSSARTRFKASLLYNLNKIEHVKKYFSDLSETKPEMYEEMVAIYNDWEFQLSETLGFISELDDFKKGFLDALDDYSLFGLDVEGYRDGCNPTKAVNQIFCDIGRSVFHGSRYFFKKRIPSIDRSVSSSSGPRNKNSYNINKSLANLSAKPIPSSEILHYIMRQMVYTSGDPISAIQNGPVGAEFASIINGFGQRTNHSSTYQSVLLAQYVWTELMNSYIYANADNQRKAIWDQIRSNGNMIYDIVGDSFDFGILDANNSKGLAKSLRFPFKGQTIMPFERPGIGFESNDKKLANVRTGIDSWIDPNIGNIFEGNETDYTGLDNWSEQFVGLIQKSKERVAPFMIDGHGQLIYNEIVLGFQRLFVEAVLSHPHYIRENRDDNSSGFVWENEITTMAGAVSIGYDDQDSARRVMALLHILKECRYSDDSNAFWNLVYQSMNTVWATPNGPPRSAPTFDVNFVNKLVTLTSYSQFQAGNRSTEADYNKWSEHKAVKVKEHLLGIVNEFAKEVEKAICYDIAVNAGSAAMAPLPGPEESDSAIVWSKIFSGTDPSTYPIDVGASDVNSTDELGVQGGVRISTAYNNTNHIIIRASIIWIATEIAVSLLDGNTTHLFVEGDTARAKIEPHMSNPNQLRGRLAELFMTSVDNLNPEEGPVRWKLTYGSWPADDVTVEIQDEIYEKIIPGYARDLADAGSFNWEDHASDETIFNLQYGNLDTIEDTYELNYSFLVEKENYVPITYVADSEIPVPRGFLEETMERGVLKWSCKYSQYHREGTRRFYDYLDNLGQTYLGLKDKIDLLAEDAKAESLKTMAELPGIDVVEITKFSGARQSDLRKYLKSEEIPMPESGYIPNNNFVSSAMAESIPKFISQITEQISRKEISGKPSEGRIYAIGIPYQMMDSTKTMAPSASTKKPRERLVEITQMTQLLFAGQYSNPISRVYWPSLFINTTNFSKINPNQNMETSIANLIYGTFDPDTGEYIKKNYSQIIGILNEILQSTSGFTITAEEIVKNHYNDFVFKTYLKYYSGINIDETSFSINPDSNKLYLDKFAVENIDDIFEGFGLDDLAVIFDDINIVNFKDFNSTAEGDMEDNYVDYSNMVAVTQSRLVSKEQMATKILVPNIFDRVFCFYTHVAEYRLSQSHLKYVPEYIKKFFTLQSDGNFAINLDENPHGNFLLNDHVTSNIFTVVVR